MIVNRLPAGPVTAVALYAFLRGSRIHNENVLNLWLRESPAGAGRRRAGRAKGQNATGSTAGLQLGGSSQRHTILHSVARAPDLADKVPQKSPDRSRGSCRTIIGRKPMIG